MNITPHFSSVVSKYALLPFEYGTNDCALMVVAIYKEAFDLDITDGVTPDYNDKLGATKMYVRCGGWDGLLLKKGFEKLKNKNFVSRGDIVIAEGAAGIWIGNNAMFAGGTFRQLSAVEVVYKYKGNT